MLATTSLRVIAPGRLRAWRPARAPLRAPLRPRASVEPPKETPPTDLKRKKVEELAAGLKKMVSAVGRRRQLGNRAPARRLQGSRGPR